MSDALVANKLGLAPIGPMAATLEDVPRIVGELEAHLREKLGGDGAYAYVAASCGRGGWSIYASYNAPHGKILTKSFGERGVQTFEEAAGRMREWLAVDDDALANLTLGLDATGRFIVEGT